MANRYTVASGLWSAVATWDGTSTVPADDDQVTITAGHTVTMDADLTAYTGLRNVIISGHATTPGMLEFHAGTNGLLKIRTGYTLAGTNLAVKGRLLANNDGVWANSVALPYANTAVIDLNGSASVVATYLDIKLLCAQPTNLYVRTYKTKYRVTGSAAADTLTKASHGLTNTTPVMIMVAAGGALPAPLVADTQYYVVDTATDTFKLALTAGGTAIDLTTDGTGDIDVYDGHASTATGVMNVLNDVTADAPWVTTALFNSVVLVNGTVVAANDQQRTTLKTIAAGTIEFNDNVAAAKYPGSRIYLTARNVAIRTSTTTAATKIIDSAVSGVFQCSVRSTAGTGTTFYADGFNGGSGNTISGTISGCTNGLSYSYNNTISGTISGCTSGLRYSYNNTISGAILGCNYGGVYSYNNTISGTILGCANGLDTCYNNTISGAISGCTYGGVYAHNNTISGTISGCTNGLGYSYNNTVSGTISGCTYGFYTSSNNTISGTISGCTYDTILKTSVNTLINAALSTSPSFSSRNSVGGHGRQICHNLNRVDGAMKIFDNFGDIIKTACNGTGAAPSVDPNGGLGYCIEASNLQSNLTVAAPQQSLEIFSQHHLWMTAVAHTVTYKVQTNLASGIAAGSLKLTAKYIDGAGVLTETSAAPAIATRATAADWSQSIAVTFTPTVAGWVDLKLEFYQYESGKAVYVWPTPVVS